MAGRVITIAQQKGGAGKTTVAAHLALAAHALGKRVALVDIDPQGSLSRWFQLREGQDSGLTLSTVTGWRGSAEVERLAREHDIVILDSPPHAQTDAKMAIRAGHLIVVPIQPSPLDFWATLPTLELAKAERRPLLLVLNRVPARSTLADEIIEQIRQLGAGLARTKLVSSGAFATSMATGRTVTETAPKGVAARQVMKLAGEVLDRVRG